MTKARKYYIIKADIEIMLPGKRYHKCFETILLEANNLNKNPQYMDYRLT